jgi:hypothetical protein
MTTEEIVQDAEEAARAVLSKGPRHHLRRWRTNQEAVTGPHRAFARKLLSRPEVVVVEGVALCRANS